MRERKSEEEKKRERQRERKRKKERKKETDHEREKERERGREGGREGERETMPGVHIIKPMFLLFPPHVIVVVGGGDASFLTGDSSNNLNGKGMETGAGTFGIFSRFFTTGIAAGYRDSSEAGNNIKATGEGKR